MDESDTDLRERSSVAPTPGDLAPWERSTWHAADSTSPLAAADIERARRRQRRREAAHGRRRGTSSGRRAARPRAAPGTEWRRLRRLIALGLVLTVSAVAIGSMLQGGSEPTLSAPAAAVAPAAALLDAPPPEPVRLATRDSVTLYVPINARQITAIAYHRVDGSRALDLAPAGRLLNGGIVDRIKRTLLGLSSTGPAYYVSDGSTASVDIGARAGTQAYSPVTGTVVAIAPYVLNGDATHYGQVVTIQPTADPSVEVVLSHIAVDGLGVGDQVVATPQATYLGRIVDLSHVLRMDLGNYTTDAGNGLHLEVQPAEISDIP